MLSSAHFEVSLFFIDVFVVLLLVGSGFPLTSELITNKEPCACKL